MNRPVESPCAASLTDFVIMHRKLVWKLIRVTAHCPACKAQQSISVLATIPGAFTIAVTTVLNRLDTDHEIALEKARVLAEIQEKRAS